MTIKKLISIILTMAMLISIAVITVSADYDAVIAENETISVSVSEDEYSTVKFVAEETKKLSFRFNPDDLNCTVYLYDENYEELYSWMTGSYVGSDRVLEYDFEAGKTYYFEIKIYSSDVASVDMTIECAHSFIGDTCEWCDKVCDHNTELSFLKNCACGFAFDGADIECGNTVEVAGAGTVLRFVPEETGTYMLRSDDKNNDPICELFCGKDYVTSGDDFANGANFVLLAELEAGVPYFYCISNYVADDENAFTVTLSEAVHTAADGTEHPVEYHEASWGTCQETVYTDGLYCAECGEYVEGYLENGKGGHEDNNGDYFCDLCGNIMLADLLFFSEFSFVIEIALKLFEFVEKIMNAMFDFFGIDGSEFSFNIFNLIG